MSLSITEQFLRAVLPEEGAKALTVFQGDRQFNQFYNTIEELAAALLYYDGLGNTVYHACATYKVGHAATEDHPEWGRKQVNAYGARSFWLDVDAGEGKPYPDAAGAAVAVLEFCARTGLPAPLFVSSGGGCHCYWPLAGVLNPDDWFRYSSGLKSLCREHGLHADPSRTSDIASILRPPGTHNRKRGEALVQMGEIVGPYGLELFHSLLAAGQAAPAAAPTKPQNRLAERAMNIYAPVPVYPDYVADNCQQMAHFRSTGGIPEPLWYACIGVLAFCEEGEECAHDWSSRDFDGYSETETQAKFERAKALSGPTTCRKFMDVAPAGCAGCPFAGKITSPTQLGYADAAAAGDEDPSPHITVRPSLDIPEKDEPLPGVPYPFAWKKGALVLLGEDNDGEEDNILISSFPVYLDSVQTSEAGRLSITYLFKQYLPHQGWLDILIPAKALMSASGVAEMFDRGATIHDNKAFNKYVRYAVDNFNATEKLRMRYDQFGWKDDGKHFLFGKKLYTSLGIRDVQGNTEVNSRSQWIGPTPGGSLAGWSAAANALFAAGAEAQAFALLASFAAPLMRFHSRDEGGAIVSLLSRESGTGKTTALVGAASVWGRFKGFCLTNLDTDVAKATTLAVLGNLPVVYDELGNRDPQVLKDWVLTFTNGRDRMRGTVDGSIRHSEQQWQTIMITGGNRSIVDAVDAAGGSDAAGFRIIELGLGKLTQGFQKGDALRTALDKNHGWAGDAYLKYITQPAVADWISQQLPAWTQEMWEETGFNSEHRFWVRTMASVAVAAKLVQTMGILEFTPSRILGFAKERMQDAKNTAVVTAFNPNEGSVAAVSQFLAEHIANMVVFHKAFERGVRDMLPIVKPQGRLLIRYEREPGKLIISERHLKEWLVKHEIGTRDTYRDLEVCGVMVASRRMVTLTAGTDYAGGQIPCVILDAKHPAISGTLREAAVEVAA